MGECPGHHMTSVTPVSPTQVKPGRMEVYVGQAHVTPSVAAHPLLSPGGHSVDCTGHGKRAITGPVITPPGHSAPVTFMFVIIVGERVTHVGPVRALPGIGSPKGNSQASAGNSHDDLKHLLKCDLVPSSPHTVTNTGVTPVLVTVKRTINQHSGYHGPAHDLVNHLVDHSMVSHGGHGTRPGAVRALSTTLAVTHPVRCLRHVLVDANANMKLIDSIVYEAASIKQQMKDCTTVSSSAPVAATPPRTVPYQNGLVSIPPVKKHINSITIGGTRTGPNTPLPVSTVVLAHIRPLIPQLKAKSMRTTRGVTISTSRVGVHIPPTTTDVQTQGQLLDPQQPNFPPATVSILPSTVSPGVSVNCGYEALVLVRTVRGTVAVVSGPVATISVLMGSTLL